MTQLLNHLIILLCVTAFSWFCLSFILFFLSEDQKFHYPVGLSICLLLYVLIMHSVGAYQYLVNE